MKARCVFFQVLLFFLTASVSAQSWFESTIGDFTANESAVSVVQASDGTLFLGGTTDRSGHEDFALLEISSSGALVNEYLFGTSGSDFLKRMLITDDDSAFYFCGETVNIGSTNTNALLLKVSPNGSVLWVDTFGSMSAQETFTGMTLTLDGSVIVSGDIADSSDGFDHLIVKYDLNGNKQWQSRIERPGNDISANIVEAASGNLFLAGDLELRPGMYNTVLYELDDTGQLLNSKVIDNSQNSGCKNLLMTSDGNLLVSGEIVSPVDQSFDAFLVMADQQLDTIWTTSIGFEGGEHAFDAVELSNGHFYAAGFGYNSGNRSTDMLLVELDPLGNLIEPNVRYYGDAGIESAAAITITQSGFLIAGHNLNGNDDQYYLVHDRYDHPLAIEPTTASEIENLKINGNQLSWQLPESATELQVFDHAGRLIFRKKISNTIGHISIQQAVLQQALVVRVKTESRYYQIRL